MPGKANRLGKMLPCLSVAISAHPPSAGVDCLRNRLVLFLLYGPAFSPLPKISLLEIKSSREWLPDRNSRMPRGLASCQKPSQRRPSASKASPAQPPTCYHVVDDCCVVPLTPGCTWRLANRFSFSKNRSATWRHCSVCRRQTAHLWSQTML